MQFFERPGVMFAIAHQGDHRGGNARFAGHRETLIARHKKTQAACVNFPNA
jgi:hypothetical protein